VSELWNIGEVAVGLWSGFQAGSVALIAFGLDSVIEVFAGAVAIRSLRREWTDGEKVKAAEKRELRLLRMTFFILSGYIATQALVTLLGWVKEPRESLVGIGLVVATAVSMTILFRAKSTIAGKLGSSVLRKEAVENLVCDLQDLTVLAGLGLNLLLGWWWADPRWCSVANPIPAKRGIGILERYVLTQSLHCCKSLCH
jgi:divalent metal cation (Fe/Co/Zn/Cd) transporter